MTLVGVKASCGLYVHLTATLMFLLCSPSWVHGPQSETPSITSSRGSFEGALPPPSVKLHSSAITCGSGTRPAATSRSSCRPVMARLVGLDCALNKLARRMKCTQCNGRRVTVRAVEPGERSGPSGASVGFDLVRRNSSTSCRPDPRPNRELRKTNRRLATTQKRMRPSSMQPSHSAEGASPGATAASPGEVDGDWQRPLARRSADIYSVWLARSAIKSSKGEPA